MAQLFQNLQFQTISGHLQKSGSGKKIICLLLSKKLNQGRAIQWLPVILFYCKKALMKVNFLIFMFFQFFILNDMN